MELKKVTAIVTRATRYHETDMIVNLVTLEEGRLTATARGCLKPKAKLRYAAEPMNFGEYMLSGNGDRYIVADCSQIESFSPITCDLDKFYASSMILEVLQKLSAISQPQLFMHAINALKGMAYEGKDAQEGITDFLLDALKDGGFDFDFSTCNDCKCMIDGDCAYSERDGIICPHCAGNDCFIIDGVSRAYIANEDRNISSHLKNRANMLLADIVNSAIGVKINNQYFTEKI